MSQISELWQRIDDAKAALDKLRPLDREREERAMQKFRLWWTYHSNAIEGNSLTQGETEVFLMEGLTAKNKPLKDHLDLRGHSDAINYLQDFIRDKEVLTEAAIRKLHEILLVEPYEVDAITPSGLPTRRTIEIGTYKTQPNHVRTRTGATHFYTSPEETPAKMHDLMDWYRAELERGAMHRVEIAARYHHRFTAIHPFDDGNGRMSRIIMNLILMQAGYPPAVIRIGERDNYLAALRRADAGECEEFIAFIGEHVVDSLELYIRAAKGEEIQEPTDLEKEIVLLKMELSSLEEPQVLTAPVQLRLFQVSLNPLIQEIVRLLKPLSDYFVKSSLLVEATQGRAEEHTGARVFNPPVMELTRVEGLPQRDEYWAQGQVLSLLYARFELKEFKRGQFDSFNLSKSLEFRFDRRKYFVSYPADKPRTTIEHSYRESLTKEEMLDVAQYLARFFLNGIKEKIKIGS